MFEQPQVQEPLIEQKKKTYLTRAKKAKTSPKHVEQPPYKEKLTKADLAADEGLSAERYEQKLNEKIAAKIEEAKKALIAEKQSKIDLDKNIEDAYTLKEYLRSENRPDAGLLTLDSNRLWQILRTTDRLRAESQDPESKGIYPEARIAALDLSVEVLYDLYAKERLDQQRNKPGFLGTLGLLSKEKLERAWLVKQVQQWASDARRETRLMVMDLQKMVDVTTPEEKEILDRLKMQLDDLVTYVKKVR